jgi:hypothetical protein
MKFRADITTCENDQDKILSVCQSSVNGEVEHEVIIQRGPKEYDAFDDVPGPKITCDELGLDLVPGPERIIFSGNTMTIVLSEPENIEVDISRLTKGEIRELRAVAKAIFK